MKDRLLFVLNLVVAFAIIGPLFAVVLLAWIVAVASNLGFVLACLAVVAITGFFIYPFVKDKS